MNRSLFIPALCCLFAFAALSAVLHRTVGQEANSYSSDVAPASGGQTVTMPSTISADDELSAEEAEAMLTTLVEEHLRPWREWEKSPHRLYSRVGPRPLPTLVVKVTMSPAATSERDAFHLATIAITTGEQLQSIPCIVDRSTQEVRLFADGQWLTGEQWAKKGKSPLR